MNVLFASPELENKVSEFDLRSLQTKCHESLRSGRTLFHVFNEEAVLRIVPLNAGLFGCVAIFVDLFDRHGPVYDAAKKFGLTKRESEILRLLLLAKTNNDIAITLFLAKSTVADHMKSIFRKLEVSKRAEIPNRIFDLEPDIAAERL